MNLLPSASQNVVDLVPGIALARVLDCQPGLFSAGKEVLLLIVLIILVVVIVIMGVTVTGSMTATSTTSTTLQVSQRPSSGHTSLCRSIACWRPRWLIRRGRWGRRDVVACECACATGLLLLRGRRVLLFVVARHCVIGVFLRVVVECYGRLDVPVSEGQVLLCLQGVSNKLQTLR
jgi:hypothetical protein